MDYPLGGEYQYYHWVPPLNRIHTIARAHLPVLKLDSQALCGVCFLGIIYSRGAHMKMIPWKTPRHI